MKLEIKNTQGENAGDLDVREDVFNVPIKPALVHQVMVGQLANKRQGTAKTKTRSEVSGGGAKPRPQKHTGSSRQGSTRSPIWVGGGRAFGPTPRSYRKRTPKKMRRLALLSVLSDKARQSDVLLLDSLELKQNTASQLRIQTTLTMFSSRLTSLRAIDARIFDPCGITTVKTRFATNAVFGPTHCKSILTKNSFTSKIESGT